jgi:uncharacterized membrane protein HdeD (DUF308 family)
MKKRNYNVIGYDTRYWWLLLGGGILFIVVGFWIIFSAQKTYLFLSMLLSIGMLATGLFETLFSLVNRKLIKDWGWIFGGGLIDFLLGLYFLEYPLLSLIFMPMVIGIWMLFRGFMTISSSVKLNMLGMVDWIWMMITSALLILPSIVILINPFVGLINIVRYTGAAFILSGLFRIFFSQQLRRLKSAHVQTKKRKKHLDYNHNFL